MGPGRLHALIDGVFAIALTLLVLDLPKPQHSTQLVHDLLRQWPSEAMQYAYDLSGDRRFLERTLTFLLFISVIPWPTALAADYAGQGSGEARAAAILYAATMMMMGLTFAWGWHYLTIHSELVAEPARRAFPAGTRRALLGGLVYLLAIGVAFISPLGSFAIDAVVAGYFAVSKSEVPGLIVKSSPAKGST